VSKVLVIYATNHGHTRKIANRIAEVLRGKGIEVDLREATDDSAPDSGGYDGVLAAASIHAEHHQREMVEWAIANRPNLESKPSTFISVSLTAADDTEEAHKATQRCIDAFLEETGWTPTRTVSVAGALQYQEYDFFTKTLMRLMMKRGGHPTDASRDYDYTDWDRVEQIGSEFAAQIDDD
jgi:menaquinone-dependent protoporphyrinogen oxidase